MWPSPLPALVIQTFILLLTASLLASTAGAVAVGLHRKHRTVQHSPGQAESATAAQLQQWPPVADGVQLYTFFGETAHGQSAIWHILLKAKRLADQSYVVRAVTYTEAQGPGGDGSGEWNPLGHHGRELDLHFRRWLDDDRKWEVFPFERLPRLVGTGPYVHEARVPPSAASQTLQLRVLDWPKYYDLEVAKLAAQNPHGVAYHTTSGAFSNAVVLPDFMDIAPRTAAKLLATHMAHHRVLGFERYYLCYRSAEMLEALVDNAHTAASLASGALRLLSLVDMQLPQYDDVIFAYDPVKLACYNRAALGVWGEHTRLAVLDPDEFWMSGIEGSTVNDWFSKCFDNAELLPVGRISTVCGECDAHEARSEMAAFDAHWLADNPLKVLTRFNVMTATQYDTAPKSIVLPDRVGQVWMHTAHVLPDTKEHLVHVSAESDGHVEPNCAWVQHFVNLFGHRLDAPSPGTQLQGWQWIIEKYQAHKHKGVESVR